ncbi:hypothetical protein OHA04_27375 [Streptomyces sp. NBC_01590]|uniref:hypothetical protein n=1 Tax=Streptomyces sp. NBC_01590 TaxID=2975887 RepID=UPI00386BE341
MRHYRTEPFLRALTSTDERDHVSTDEEQRSPCPAHDFGNALAWRWTREMPRTLKGGFLTMLYALRAMAAASGELRFSDGKAIRIQDMAKAAGCREQDARRYLDAGILAGVVGIDGDRRRGKATRYALLRTNWPNWQAAADHIKATARPRKEVSEESPAEQGSSHSGPNLDGENIGPQRPELSEGGENGVRSTEARMGSVHSGLIGSGHSGPNNPGVTQGVTQEMVDVVTQPQVVAGEASSKDEISPVEERPWGQCSNPECGVRLLRATSGLCHGCQRQAEGAQQDPQAPVQGAFLTPMPAGPTGPAAAPQEATQPFKIPQQDPGAPLRVCGCGREHRAHNPADRCPDCLWAEHAQAVNGR